MLKDQALRWALIVGVALPLAAVAQQARVLTGTVRDGAEVVRGAVVQIENTNTLEIRSYITQKDGAYHFAQLSPDVDYEVWAQRDDKRSPKKRVSKFDSAQRVVVDLSLK